jgi:hypothetical protein
MKMFEIKSIVFKGDGKITFNILRMIFCCFTTTSRETKFRYQLTKQAIISLPIVMSITACPMALGKKGVRMISRYNLSCEKCFEIMKITG